MYKFTNKVKTRVDELYNKILLLSRNKLLYSRLGLNDTFYNRIILIFIHISFIFIKIKQNNNKIYKVFNQKTFDLIFKKIEINLREVGHGDTTINKNMKLLVKTFYNILLNCENYKNKSSEKKIVFFNKYFDINVDNKNTHNTHLLGYFDKYQTFCLDLSIESVLKGDINFNYK